MATKKSPSAAPAAAVTTTVSGSTKPAVIDDAAILATIRKYSQVYQEAANGLADEEDAAPEPTYTPGTLAIPDGYVSLSDLIPGAKAIPVKVFSPMDWPEEIRSYIPETLPNNGQWHWDLALAEQLAFALYCDDRTLLHGPTGSGKSALVEAWCHLVKVPLIRVNCHRDMQSTDFLGKDVIRATDKGPVLEYEWSLTTLAAMHGGLLLIDEAFRSPHLMAIQSLLERRGTLTLPDAASLTPAQRKIVPPAGKSWVVLTDNNVGTGDESGAYTSEVQDTSTLDRITAAVYVGYATPAQEQKDLGEDFPALPKKVLKNITEWAGKMREAFLARAVQQPISRRALGAILRKYAITGDLAAAAKLSYINKLAGNDAHTAREAWMQVFGEELTAK